MKKKSDRYRKFSASPEDEISDRTCTTRLFEYDIAEVEAMCGGGKKKSDVIRELVRKALYARRYRQASTDPAFKEIIKSFDDRVGVRVHHLEERLTNRMEADFALSLSVLGYLYFDAFFGVEEMKQVHLRVSPEQTTDGEFLAEWEERFAAVWGRADATLRAAAERRRKRLGPGGEAEEGPDAGGGGHSSE